jgi:hypothetical protein
VNFSYQGLIVLVERGNCTFDQKRANVLAVGGSGVIVINSRPRVILFTPISDPDSPMACPSLPTVLVSYEDGQRLKLEMVCSHLFSA